jgi:hypothetical protein
MKRITTINVCEHPAWYPGARKVGRDLAFYLGCLDGAGSRWEAESRLLQALDDRAVSDDAYHTVRLRFDALAEKGWGTDE